RLASMLWNESSAEHAHGSLRHALSELCSAMGPLAEELISAGRANISFNTDTCWIDALEVLESSSPDPVRSDIALLCAGELLEGVDGVSTCFDRWLTQERVRLREKRAELREAPIPLSSSSQQHAHSLPLLSIGAHRPSPARNRLRVAVLPFDGQGGGKSAERAEDFAFSLSHDIAIALTRFRWFDVIAPVSFASAAAMH